MPEPRDNEYRSIDSREAENLCQEGSVRILDVRTPQEYRQLGHIPGALLLPVDWMAIAPATLDPEGKPILVTCEHGVRSVMAASLLARAGFTGVLNLSGGLSAWKGPRDFSPGDPYRPVGPSAWVIENSDLWPRKGRVLDVACGRGRHALLLASAGYSVSALDQDASKIDYLRKVAASLGLPISAERVDLEAGPVDLRTGEYDLIVVVHYLHRPLFPTLLKALSRGGILLYETFTTAQAERGKPTCPDYLLTPGELERKVAPLQILRKREGDYEGRMISSVAARRP